MKTPLSSVFLVIVAGLIGSFGAVLLKAGAKRLEKSIAGVLRNWRLLAGVAAYLLSAVFFVLGMRRGELSILYPMVALGYLWTVIWARVFFAELITRGKVIGIALILCGIVALGIGK